MWGATDAEIEDVVHYAKSSDGWSTCITGIQMDFDQFRKAVTQACDYVPSRQEVPALQTSTRVAMLERQGPRETIRGRRLSSPAPCYTCFLEAAKRSRISMTSSSVVWPKFS